MSVFICNSSVILLMRNVINIFQKYCFLLEEKCQWHMVFYIIHSWTSRKIISLILQIYLTICFSTKVGTLYCAVSSVLQVLRPTCFNKPPQPFLTYVTVYWSTDLDIFSYLKVTSAFNLLTDNNSSNSNNNN